MAKKPTRPPLTKKREAWAQERGGAIFRGLPLVVSAPAELRYRNALLKQVDAMTAETLREFKALMRRPDTPDIGLDASFASMVRKLFNKLRGSFEKSFGGGALGIAKNMAKGVDLSSKSQLHASLKEVSGGLSLKTSVITGTVEEVTKAAIAENVSLIKSIPSEYFRRIEGDVFRSIQSGQGMADLVPAIESYGHSTRKRAELIARDQTSKATTAINSARMEGLGIKKFEWMHSGGGKEPRELHVEYDGQIFDLAAPPIIDLKTGERGLPGQLINCKCRMKPVISFAAQEVK